MEKILEGVIGATVGTVTLHSSRDFSGVRGFSFEPSNRPTPAMKYQVFKVGRDKDLYAAMAKLPEGRFKTWEQEQIVMFRRTHEELVSAQETISLFEVDDGAKVACALPLCTGGVFIRRTPLQGATVDGEGNDKQIVVLFPA